MEVKDLLNEGRMIWGESKMTLDEIIPAMGVVFGDLCRWARNSISDASFHTQEELKKELGNMLFSTIRWCDDLGFDVEECIELAKDAQRKFKKS